VAAANIEGESSDSALRRQRATAAGRSTAAYIVLGALLARAWPCWPLWQLVPYGQRNAAGSVAAKQKPRRWRQKAANSAWPCWRQPWRTARLSGVAAEESGRQHLRRGAAGSNVMCSQLRQSPAGGQLALRAAAPFLLASLLSTLAGSSATNIEETMAHRRNAGAVCSCLACWHICAAKGAAANAKANGLASVKALAKRQRRRRRWRSLADWTAKLARLIKIGHATW